MISKKLFLEFEMCRESGECNMLDDKCIMDFCLENKLTDLCNITKDQHKEIIERYNYYYGIYKGGK